MNSIAEQRKYDEEIYKNEQKHYSLQIEQVHYYYKGSFGSSL